MSQFLPEGFGQQPSTTVDLSSGAPASDSTQADVALMQRVLAAAANNPNLIPGGFMAYMLDWIQTQRLSIPIGQVFGFTRFAAKTSVETGSVSTASSTYVTLGGPNITGLSAGKYLMFWGAAAVGNLGVSNATMALSTNTVVAPATDNQIVAITSDSSFTSIMAADTITLVDGENVIGIEYVSSDGASTVSFQQRFIIALRYAN